MQDIYIHVLVRAESPRVVLWRAEALDRRVLIPPEAWSCSLSLSLSLSLSFTRPSNSELL